MKHTKLVLLAVAALSLSGCDLFGKKEEGGDGKKAKTYDFTPEVVGGTEEDKIAIYEALNYIGTCYYGSNDIEPETPMPVAFEDGKYIQLFKTVKYDNDHVVQLTWEVDDEQDYYKDVLHADDTHDYIEINYKLRDSDTAAANPDGRLSWTLKKIECNDAVSNANLEYEAIVTNSPYFYQKQSISELYGISDEVRTVTYEGNKEAKYASTFNICTYDAPEADDDGKYPVYKPGFTPNNPSAKENEIFRYQEVLGKHFYSAPDGNFGLIRNGKDVLEIYAGSGSGTPLVAKEYPRFNDEYVKVFGTMGQYCGNIQLSFITQVMGVTAAEKATIEDVSASEEYEPLDEDRLASLKVTGFDCEKQAVQMDGHGFSNSLREVTGTLVAGSLKDKDGKAVAASAMKNGKGYRYTFELAVGDEKITVAYDYHTDQQGKVGLFNAMKAALTAGGSMTIK